ncbi:MAG: branched-chain amino acid ABC transporter permease [Rickettsiales bacterium]|jgi:branched-chain amino acid transport system permease protein|nr:branched-chain amino acid ABC transporter permease [Rickettsiales bacterium]
MLYQLILNTLIIGSGYALVAMAFRLMYWVSPFFNLTLGASAALGAYLGYALVPVLGAGAWPVVAVGVALFTWGLESFVYKPVRDLGASPMVLLVVSLGVYTVFESVIHLLFGPQYQTLGSATDFSRIAGIPTAQFAIVVFAAVVLVAVSVLLQRTFFGKQVRAIHDSPQLAHMVGLNVPRVVMITSVLVGGILGAYGLMVGYDTGMEPTMGFNLLFKGMIAAIIGGPTILGAYLGAMILAAAENLGVWMFASQWRDVVAFVIFIVLLYIRPNGIFNFKRKQKQCEIKDEK